MVWGFFAKIGKGAFNTGYKSVNFAVDIAQEALGADDIEGAVPSSPLSDLKVLAALLSVLYLSLFVNPLAT